MSRRPRTSRPKDQPAVGGDLLRAIRFAFPDGVVESVPDPEESALAGISDELRAKLAQIKGTRPLLERPPRPEPEWGEGADPEEDPPDFMDFSRSYLRFFVAPSGPRFESEVETEVTDEEGRWRPVTGRSHIGWTVAVSLIAPVAIITVCDVTTDEDGESLPEIETARFREDGAPISPDEYLHETLGDREIAELNALRGKIETVLQRLGLPVLSEAELRQPVPWLRAGEGTICQGMHGSPLDHQPVTVLGALFFEEP